MKKLPKVKRPTRRRPNRERFVVTLEALPSPVPVPVRLRRLLKYSLRALQLRCTQIIPADAGGDRDGSEVKS